MLIAVAGLVLAIQLNLLAEAADDPGLVRGHLPVLAGAAAEGGVARPAGAAV